ncbi:GNAT family N-acetyltransferase [Pseudomonas prosekii]|uniref:N-acetyltransferase n=1 Tax=Pseudomonas prosekii TaxID=1148509 RepID=A0A2U2D339_9PSED|nr:GNAT family N-acetyltransferase [Pseudomonas prosekii]PWE41109.1 N-acetyltransferase [Pseudomonas prosekii]
MRWQIRQAVLSDFRWLVRVDSLAENDDDRRTQIAIAISKGQCWVACDAGDPAVPVGYGCLDKSFFGEWFVPLVIVSNAHRRCGIGRKIIAHLEHCSSATKIFTSTNMSNTPMRQLLAQLGYQSSGVVENLDPGDPELIFMKVLDE